MYLAQSRELMSLFESARNLDGVRWLWSHGIVPIKPLQQVEVRFLVKESSVTNVEYLRPVNPRIVQVMDSPAVALCYTKINVHWRIHDIELARKWSEYLLDSENELAQVVLQK